jgi:hypothetical protein
LIYVDGELRVKNKRHSEIVSIPVLAKALHFLVQANGGRREIAKPGGLAFVSNPDWGMVFDATPKTATGTALGTVGRAIPCPPLLPTDAIWFATPARTE